MSKYYDASKPYSIDNWNTLIRDVNETLENPPEGSDCQPVAPLEEVSDPHVWLVDDVTEVRDALKKTCPDIEFSEDTEVWHTAIIDEIADQMERAWCNCHTEPDEEDIVTGTFQVSEVEACPWGEGSANPALGRTCGSTVWNSCFVCKGQLCTETSYSGTYYSQPDNAGALDAVCESYDTAWQATWYWMDSTNKMVEYRAKIIEYQNKTDAEAGSVDALIGEYKAKCLGENRASNCNAITAGICFHGEIAQEHQKKVDEYVEKFQAEHGKLAGYLKAADEAAEKNWAAVLSLQVRFPTDHNAAQGMTAHIMDETWKAWFNPKTDSSPNYDLQAYSLGSRAPNELRPHLSVYYTNPTLYKSGQQPGLGEIKTTPSGKPFVTGAPFAASCIRDTSKPFTMQKSRHRCEALIGTPPMCGDTPKCEWGPWQEQRQDWGQGLKRGGCCAGSCLGFCNQLFIPINAANALPIGTETFHLTIVRPPSRKGKDYTAEQEEEWNKCLNWYDEHEKYDDRHEAYC